MKAILRATLLATVFAVTVAGPVFAGSGSSSHESWSTCFTDEFTGFTYCSAWEADTRTKEKRSGASDVRLTTTLLDTVYDADGNLVSSLESKTQEHEVTLLASDGAYEIRRFNIWIENELMDGGVTTCTRTHVVARGDTDRVNDVTTTDGPC
jgi:hypothetical protein